MFRGLTLCDTSMQKNNFVWRFVTGSEGCLKISVFVWHYVWMTNSIYISCIIDQSNFDNQIKKFYFVKVLSLFLLIKFTRIQITLIIPFHLHIIPVKGYFFGWTQILEVFGLFLENIIENLKIIIYREGSLPQDTLLP